MDSALLGTNATIWLDGREMTGAEFAAIPADVRAFLGRTYQRDGVRRWNSNDVVVPVDRFPAGAAMPEGQAAAAATQVRLWDRAAAGATVAELVAEFGRGWVVLDVETGRTWRL